MKKTVILKIGSIVVIVAVTLAILLATTKMPNEAKNGFTRTYLNSDLPIFLNAPLKEVLTNISGTTASSIFLASQRPQALLILNKNLKHRDTLLLNAPIPDEKMTPFAFFIDSPMVYLHINNMKSVIYGRFPKQDLHKTEIKSQIFTKSVQVSPSSFIIRGFHSSIQKQVFQKIDLQNGRILIEKDIVDSLDAIGGMASDGMLSYEKETASVIYVEYFRNKFYRLDTNLNLIYKKNTIDTISSNQVQVKDIQQPDGTIKKVPSIARIQVNDQCFTDKSYIYIISALRADNENLKEFNQHTVIDVYYLTDGSYRGSIKMRKRGKAFKSAVMQNDTLIALYDKEIAYYKLTF